jgi:hypothetical protein
MPCFSQFGFSNGKPLLLEVHVSPFQPSLFRLSQPSVSATVTRV